MSGKEEFELYILKDQSEFEHFHSDIELIFVMEGTVVLNLIQDKYELEKEDIVIVNRNRRHGLYVKENAIACVIHIDYNRIMSMVDSDMLVFYCNSILENNEKYDKLRLIIGKLLNEYYTDSDKMNCLKMSCFYQLIHYMIKYFMVNQKISMRIEAHKRIETALQHINLNYNRPITLTEMGTVMYMAPASFSRFFKKASGLTFVEYLNNIRLHHALEDLLYTDKSLTSISMDHGFSNISVFNKVFKKIYGVSPSYFKKNKVNLEKEEKKIHDVKKDLESYRNKMEFKILLEKKIQLKDIVVNAGTYTAYKRTWNQALNIGRCHLLQSAAMQKQIILLKQELNFEYGRIWGIWRKEMQLWEGHAIHAINFSSLDNIFDFLVESKIKPIICLDNKPDFISKDVNDFVYENAGDTIFETIKECITVVQAVIMHFTYRYGKAEVGQWMFECWYDEGNNNMLGIKADFTDCFTSIYRCIKAILPDTRIGGCGLSVSIGEERFRNLIQNWKKAEVEPDFISAYIFPCEISEVKGKRYSRRKKYENFFEEELQQDNAILAEYGWEHIPIYVMEWNTSFSQRNFYNDSCAKGAHMLHNMSLLLNKLELGAYGQSSDISGNYYDTNRLLNGASGLLSNNGIRKPAFYAIKFISLLNHYLIKNHDGYIITTDGFGNFDILLYNNKRFSYQYYEKKEYELSIEHMDDIFEDMDEVEITITLEQVDNGHYIVHKQGISPEKGSIQDEWVRMRGEINPTLDNINYLKQISIPYQKNDEINVTHGSLNIRESLVAHEILLLQIFK